VPKVLKLKSKNLKVKNALLPSKIGRNRFFRSTDYWNAGGAIVMQLFAIPAASKPF
jgi:hypothetical protein